ncbi:MAG: FAD-dependent oxidoreductase [Archangium sp.]|nr:FAD-dependent oxidoreductase [Archangium sp.]MDP3575535.1 FAD-dependent oxidoreductase [Archangium sp.]
MLPAHLQERLEPNAPAPREGDFVIYWMRIAARVTENPALDVALTAAAALGKKVFVYHALSERYRYANDRLHTFILEGARDVQRACAERGLGYAFHLERADQRAPVLLELAKRAALVVTDFMPVQPLLRWDAEVAKVVPLWRVDASCLAPVWSIKKVVDRAFEFRALAQPLWKERIGVEWKEVATGPAWLPALPFEPLDLQSASIPELVASCEVDHTVSPVHHTPGGSVAGLARWRKFRDGKLARYAKDRNDPVKEGNSRLSAYFHFGHLSPFLVAREAASALSPAGEGEAGQNKFLDELLVWRELSWHFCLHHPQHETLQVLPAWARDTLRAHERDGRTYLPSAEQLARAQTGDLLWDAAQRQLLTHGELHNNVRMTWGKALIGWTRNAQEALSTLLDLNHRYALDGRDPASSGGILWCLGGLDRPFSPEVPVLGSVRPRPTAEQMLRFDVGEYERRVHRPSRGGALTVAVVGGGVAGAAAARTLKDAGHVVTVFDKGRRAGGRLSTRQEGELRFDHGAQFFTVKDERFARWARAWWQERVINQWRGLVEGEPAREHASELVRLVGTPGMDSIVKRMLLELDVRMGVEVSGLTRDGTRWRLLDAGNHALGEFDAVVVATPSNQAAALIDPTSYALASRLRDEVVMAPCWAVMVQFPESPGVEWDASRSTVGPLSWLSKNSSKPERPAGAGESWVLHASAAWSRAHLELEPEAVVPMLMDAFFATTGARKVAPSFTRAHRWRYGLTEKPLGEACLWDEEKRLAVCGDWCLGADIESAFLSGSAAAGRINAIGGGVMEEADPPHRLETQLKLI